jgi:hypothetical protein
MLVVIMDIDKNNFRIHTIEKVRMDLPSEEKVKANLFETPNHHLSVYNLDMKEVIIGKSFSERLRKSYMEASNPMIFEK